MPPLRFVKTPLKTDAAGKCTRWRVILYNPATHKQEWHTVGGTKRDAEAFERSQKSRLAGGTYISKIAKRTFEETADAWIKELRVRNRRTATIWDYQSILDCHLMPKGKAGNREGFAPREVGSIRKADFKDHFAAMREAGATVNTINKTLSCAKTILNFALDQELIERNVLARHRPYEIDSNDTTARKALRGTFSEAEVRQLLNVARPFERSLIALFCFTGLRPGEAYALDWSAVDLEAGTLRVERSWDHRGKKFTEPKTKAGNRLIPLSGWLVTELKAHRERTTGTGLVFPNRVGKPLHPCNVATRVWQPLRERAGVASLDMYSLRHTFASLGRVARESAFNMSRMMGHSRSTLVDQVYAHSLQSGMASAAENVTARALGIRPQLRVIEGGNPRDVRQPLDEMPVAAQQKGLTG
jgi:integrase